MDFAGVASAGAAAGFSAEDGALFAVRFERGALDDSVAAVLVVAVRGAPARSRRLDGVV